MGDADRAGDRARCGGAVTDGGEQIDHRDIKHFKATKRRAYHSDEYLKLQKVCKVLTG
mgnify:FL=1